MPTKRAVLLLAISLLLGSVAARAEAQVRVGAELAQLRTDHADLGRMGGAAVRVGARRWELGLSGTAGAIRRFDTPCGGFIPPLEVAPECAPQWIELRSSLVSAQVGRAYSPFASRDLQVRLVPHLRAAVARVGKFTTEGVEGADSAEPMIGLDTRLEAAWYPRVRLPLRVSAGAEPAFLIPIGSTVIDGYTPVQQWVGGTLYAIGVAVQW